MFEWQHPSIHEHSSPLRIMVDFTDAYSAPSPRFTGLVGSRSAVYPRRWAEVSSTPAKGSTTPTYVFSLASAHAPQAEYEEHVQRPSDIDGRCVRPLAFGVEAGLSDEQVMQEAILKVNMVMEEVERENAEAVAYVRTSTSPKVEWPGQRVTINSGHSTSLGSEVPSAFVPAAGGAEARIGQWSVGSQMHAAGQCKPCGFFLRSMGCKDGAQCLHCHLCTAADKKQRRKARKEVLKEASRRSLRVDSKWAPPSQGVHDAAQACTLVV